MRRVVVTGIGAVTPLANGAHNTWEKLLQGKSGIKHIDHFDISDIPAKIAGLVPRGIGNELLNLEDHISIKEIKKMDDFIIYGIAAADQAIEDAGWEPKEEQDYEKTGVLIGSGIGGLPRITEASDLVNKRKARRVSPFFIPSCLINLVSGQIAIKHKCKGPNHSIVSACATGAHAIGDAARIIMLGDADIMIAGGTEAAVCRLGMAGFAAARALSTHYNAHPTLASRPWDEDRDGFVMGEGAGCLILEEYEHAKSRNASIYAEFVGYGMSCDAHHITNPAADGNGSFRSMYNALQHAKLNPENVDYINAHGTSTLIGDQIEIASVKKLFNSNILDISMSSTKSATGHLLGAAGAIEAIFSILAISENIVPPTLNLIKPSKNCQGMNLVPLYSQKRSVNIALSNSFGFGGTNASLIFKKI